MPGKVRFYKLYKKFVDEKNDGVPEVCQLKYDTPALGHQIGRTDCFTPVMVMEKEDYFHWIRKLPEGRARRKLEGLAEWRELEINREHVASLREAVTEADSCFLPEEKEWANNLLLLLQMIKQEPAEYLKVKLSEEVSDYSRERADG